MKTVDSYPSTSRNHEEVPKEPNYTLRRIIAGLALTGAVAGSTAGLNALSERQEVASITHTANTDSRGEIANVEDSIYGVEDLSDNDPIDIADKITDAVGDDIADVRITEYKNGFGFDWTEVTPVETETNEQ